MRSKESVIKGIQDAFADNEFPGSDYLQGSYEGSEPFDEIEPFKRHKDWREIPSDLLDHQASALNFFSEAGLRFFLPAYLIADLNDELQSADPLFVLVHGFSDVSVEQRIGDQVYIRRAGRSAYVNPRRYGGMTFYDYACYRLSIFTREEVRAIVEYLRYKKDLDPDGIDAEAIKAALNSYWDRRIKDAVSKGEIERFLEEDADYLRALLSKDDAG